jgi:allophanate hydrolase
LTGDPVWITRCDPEAVAAESARAVELGLPLSGMTLAVKDNVDVAGMTTTAGHPAFGHVAAASAPVVDRLVAAGSVVAGKTNLDQFATGLVGTRSPYGPCRNPHVVERIAGGSSSGSAVAVATGAADIGITTDTAGSGRIPAALCGLVGLKPTRGLVSTRGVVPAIAGVDCVGVVARSVATAAAALDVAAWFDPHDPWSRRPPIGTPVVGSGPLRIGIPRAPEPTDLDGPAAEAWAAALDHGALERLGPVVEVDIGPYLNAGALLYGGAFVAYRWHAFGQFLVDHPDGADPTVAHIVTAGRDIPAWRMAADIQRLQSLRREMENVWSEVDLLALPTAPFAPTLDEVAADPIGANNRLGRWTTGANLLDLCGAAVPCGWRHDGVPFGISFLGPAFADPVVAAAAARLVGEPCPPPPPWTGWATLVVVGAHLRGQPLNGELTARGGRLVCATSTAPRYRLHALPTDPPKPGLVRVTTAGAPIAAELWALPVDAFGDFVRRVPPPLAIGSVELEDGSRHSGFVCEEYAIDGTEDITMHGGWVAYQT